jgi:hypothetical protein
VAAVTIPAANTLPQTCDVAYKEWEGICEALASGRQMILLRKGGIDEGQGPGGFSPQHDSFWLYPTRVHQAVQGLRPGALAELDLSPAGTVRLSALALVTLTARLESIEQLDLLDDLHVWTRDTMEKRFRYRSPGLWLLGVRVYRLERPIGITVTPEFEGCKTWIHLDTPMPTSGLEPAIVDEEFARRIDRIRSILTGETT